MKIHVQNKLFFICICHSSCQPVPAVKPVIREKNLFSGEILRWQVSCGCCDADAITKTEDYFIVVTFLMCKVVVAHLLQAIIPLISKISTCLFFHLYLDLSFSRKSCRMSPSCCVGFQVSVGHVGRLTFCVPWCEVSFWFQLREKYLGKHRSPPSIYTHA